MGKGKYDIKLLFHKPFFQRKEVWLFLLALTLVASMFIGMALSNIIGK